ncbi:MAG TPA: COX15/CtaA family protein, partial [Candidatus Megaira endosymbiont of Hartmannula sinica]|nr:COX15/CtaA family protein [Candidatus Megaera endosymbiont of Hartmannula sinica]
YKYVNNGMDLNEFKIIFYVEYIHRIFARFLGIFFIIPLIYFIYSKKIKTNEYKSYLLISLLFISQALIGWYMVKSGLVNEPSVSHYRLSFHLILALALFSSCYYKYLLTIKYDIRFIKRDNNYLVTKGKINKLFILSCVILLLLILQILLGGFVAGLKAGMIYNNFPYMTDNGDYLPDILNNPTIISFRERNNSILQELNFLLSNPEIIQFMHRVNAFFVSTLIICSYYYNYKFSKESNNTKACRNLDIYNNNMIITLILQFTVGVLTIIYKVPTIPALIHQILAFILFASIMNIIHYYQYILTYKHYGIPKTDR